MSFWTRNKLPIILLTMAILLTLSAISIYFAVEYIRDSKTSSDSPANLTDADPTEESDTQPSPAVQAGMRLSNNNCRGEGPVTLTKSPMREEDFAFIIPYGMMVDGHVTPIDHQYFSPTIFNSPRDTYEVRAMANGTIVEIQSREDLQNNGSTAEAQEEYRIVFMHTCTFFTYYDLVTSLSPEIEEAFESKRNGNFAPDFNFRVRAGDLIGYIGGQTLDFAVWDTEKPLTGFVVPEHYETEPWKIYTADPYDYYVPELKVMLTEKNLRSAKPIAGKIDYDIDGKLVGNWFKEGTGGYGGNSESYYEGHLSIVPNHIDPTGTVISIGDFEGEPQQFTTQLNAPDPAEIDKDYGIVKYDLMNWMYVLPDGSNWDGVSITHGLLFRPAMQNNGCILLQLIEDRVLKMEIFPGVNCATVEGFGANSRMYER